MKLKIKLTQYRLLFTCLISIGMAICMTLCMHLLHRGLHDFEMFARNCLTSIMFGLPISIVLVRLIEKCMHKLFIIE